MPRPLRFGLVFAALFALALPAAAADVTTGDDGVPHVHNGDKPRDGVATMKLKELWRAGGVDDEDNLFGLITQVRTDDDGNVYLLDTQLHEVQVFGPDGTFEHTLSREGEGPGEVRYPVDMLFMPNGTLGLVQSFPGKIVCVDLSDTPEESFVPGGDAPTEGGFTAMTDAQSAADRLVLGGTYITTNQEEGYQVRDRFIRSYAPDGKELTTYYHDPRKYEFQKLDVDEEKEYFPQFRKWVAAPDGRVYVPVSRNEYLINVYAKDGKLERVIERDCAPLERTPEETSRVEAVMTAQLSRVPFPVEHSVSKYEETIGSLTMGPDGNLWVLSSRGTHGQPEGVMATYDVFSPDGEFVRQERIPAGGNPQLDGLMFAGKDRLILVKGFIDAITTLQTQGAASPESEEEPQPMEIVCYAIQ